MNNMRVYLAGGFRSGWQDDLFGMMVDAWDPRRDLFSNSVDLVDPRSHGLTDEREYTAWDLAAIRGSDVVVACIESDNPSMSAGLMFEVGYAHALNKPIVLIDKAGHRYHGMARAVASVVVESLDEAARFLVALAGWR